MTDARGQSGLPTAFEMLESVLLLITGAVVAAPMLPGFTLCVPVLALLAVVVLAPLLAAAALVTLAAAILAIPYLLVRSIRNIRSRRAAPTPEPVSVSRLLMSGESARPGPTAEPVGSTVLALLGDAPYSLRSGKAVRASAPASLVLRRAFAR